MSHSYIPEGRVSYSPIIRVRVRFFTTLMLHRGESGGRGLGLSHPPSPLESWEDEGGLTALRLHHEP